MSSAESKRCKRRAKRGDDWTECVIQLDNGLMTRDVTARLTTEMMKYLLYDRQQIPFPLTNSQTLHHLNDKAVNKELSSKEELLLATIEELDKVFNELICLMSCTDIAVDCVSLSLGQTLQMPKELYCIEMPAQEVYSVCHTADCPRVGLRSAVTRFFKTILNDENLLFENRKEIAITKMFVLVKVDKRYAKQAMDHSVKCHQTDQLFTPHVDYRTPKFGHKYKLILTQKQCNCSPLSDKPFTIFDDTVPQVVDNNVDQDLSDALSDVLTLEEPLTAHKEANCDFIWIQIRSSIKGFKYNSVY